VAGAAKAAEHSIDTIAKTKNAFAQYSPNLPSVKLTEEQGELWDKFVIGSLCGSLLRAEL
jgi:hypothetical protein